VGSANDDRCWEQPWKVKCPQKMLHFLWRLGHNSLALRVNLRRRGMKLDTITRGAFSVAEWMKMVVTCFSNASRSEGCGGTCSWNKPEFIWRQYCQLKGLSRRSKSCRRMSNAK
jgi:hypothetical protein